jgi:hypothetical protein
MDEKNLLEYLELVEKANDEKDLIESESSKEKDLIESKYSKEKQVIQDLIDKVLETYSLWLNKGRRYSHSYLKDITWNLSNDKKNILFSGSESCGDEEDTIFFNIPFEYLTKSPTEILIFLNNRKEQRRLREEVHDLLRERMRLSNIQNDLSLCSARLQMPEWIETKIKEISILKDRVANLEKLRQNSINDLKARYQSFGEFDKIEEITERDLKTIQNKICVDLVYEKGENINEIKQELKREGIL